MIYCGYQGTGKSTYCRLHKDTTIDLDSSAFKKDVGWENNYISHAISFSRLGKDVFISAHQNVIEALIRSKEPFKVIIPNSTKEMWKARLEFRYYKKGENLPDLKAIMDLEKNFENDMIYYHSLKTRGIDICEVVASVVTDIEKYIF